MCTTGQRYLQRTKDKRASRVIDARMRQTLLKTLRSPGMLAVLKAIGTSLPMVLAMIMTMSAGAQTGGVALEGIVRDEAGTPLAFVHVGVKGTAAGAVTDATGRFRIAPLPAGPCELVASMVGYTSASKALIAGGNTGAVTLVLRQRVVDLPTFTVQSSITGGSLDVRRAPGSAWYIGPRELQRSGQTDVGRVLRSVPGVNIQDEDGFGLRPNIGMRGAPPGRSAKITVMEDGVPIAPAPYSAPAAYYFPTLGRMHAVEVVKGGGQVRYGPHTTGGALNLVSTPVPDRTAGLVSLWGGSFGTRNLHAHAGTTY